jgi:Leucine-rich repeat (LRR) protein
MIRIKTLEDELDDDEQSSQDENEEEYSYGLQGLLDPGELVVKRIAEAKVRGAMKIVLSCMELSFVPFEVKSLRDLRILSLRGNNLTMIPSDICASLREFEELNF